MTTDADDAGRLNEAVGSVMKPTQWGPSPTPDDMDDPLFKAIWQTIKRWDIQRDTGNGYAGANGSDVMTILNAIRPTLAAYQSATGFLVRQGLVFVNQGGYTECLMCGAVQHGESIRHMPDCAAEKLRALVAGEGDAT